MAKPKPNSLRTARPTTSSISSPQCDKEKKKEKKVHVTLSDFDVKLDHGQGPEPQGEEGQQQEGCATFQASQA
jgi:hypothetical protein